MVLDLEKAYKLQYHHVIVSTNVERSKNCSIKFVKTSSEPGEKLEFFGYLKVVDPISKSAILCQIKEETVVDNILILGHVIIDIQLSGELDEIPTDNVSRIVQQASQTKIQTHPYFARNTTDRHTSEDLIRRKREIIDWLKRNRIPVEQDCANNADLLIADSVRLKPPYQYDSDYICPTRIVLKRLKHIVDSMPKESTNLDHQNGTQTDQLN